MSIDRLATASATTLWGHLRAAAAGDRDGPAGTVAVLAELDGSARLGWVRPPDWARIRELLGDGGPGGVLRGRQRLVLAGTGGWAFGVRALCEAQPGPVWTLDSLDPVITRRVLDEVGEPARAAAVAVSASGRTWETRLLARTLAEVWSRAGEPGPVWLSDRTGGLSLTGAADQVALYGTPLSGPALLAARLLGGEHFETAYRGFAAVADIIGEWAAEVSGRLPVDGEPRVVFRLPDGAGEGLHLWTLQAARQGWAGKSTRFRPWVDVISTEAAPPTEPAGPADTTQPARPVAPPQAGRRGPVTVVRAADSLVDVAAAVRSTLADPAGPAGALTGAMIATYAVAAVVTCVALRRGLRFATREAAEQYQRLLPGTGDVPFGGDHRPSRARYDGTPARHSPSTSLDGQRRPALDGYPVGGVDGYPVRNVDGHPVRGADGHPGRHADGHPAGRLGGHAIVPLDGRPVAPVAKTFAGHRVAGGDACSVVVAGWLADQAHLRTIHVVGYGDGLADAVRAVPLASRLGRTVEVYEGSAWNHHSYQQVWHTPTVGVVVLLPARPPATEMDVAPPDPVAERIGPSWPAGRTGQRTGPAAGDGVGPVTAGAADAALAAQDSAQYAIARATAASLGRRALLLRWHPPLDLAEGAA